MTEPRESQDSSQRNSDATIIGGVVGCLIALLVFLVIGVFDGGLPPYLDGHQSVLWWVVRFPLVFAGFLPIWAATTIMCVLLPSATEPLTDFFAALMGILVMFGIIFVALFGGTIMNLYNDTYGTTLVVHAKRSYSYPELRTSYGRGTNIRSYLVSEESYQVLDGPLAGETFSFWTDANHWGLSYPANNGKIALVVLTKSWMGVSMVRASDYPQ